MTLDEFEALKKCATGERRVRRPPELDLVIPCRTSPKIWASMVSMRQYNHAPLLCFLMLAIRFLVLATAGSAEGR